MGIRRKFNPYFFNWVSKFGWALSGLPNGRNCGIFSAVKKHYRLEFNEV